MTERQPTDGAGFEADQVGVGRGQPAEDRAAAEILALEEELERERERPAGALAAIERHLDEAEARAAASPPDPREDAADWLRAQREELVLAIQASVRESEAEARRATEQELREQAEVAERRLAESEQTTREGSGSAAAQPEQGDATGRRAKLAQALMSGRHRGEEPEADRERRAVEKEARRRAKQARAEERREARAKKADEAKRRAEERRATRREAKERRKQGSDNTEAPEPSGFVTAEPRVNLNEATFEQLREIGMSVTQATRAIAYREQQDGFTSVEDLASVPGLTKGAVSELSERLVV